jgi:hypothetical protein
MSSYDLEYDQEPDRAWWIHRFLWPIYVGVVVIGLLVLTVIGVFWDPSKSVSTGRPIGLINRLLKR